MDHKGFAGIADPNTLCLGIFDDVYRHGKVSGLIDIDMTISGSGLNDRDGRIVHHGTDESCSPTRNENIQIFVHLHKPVGNLAIRIGNEF